MPCRHPPWYEPEYRDLIKDPFYKQTWLTSGAIELGRLAQGLPSSNVKGTHTIFFINKHQVPHGRTVTYAHIVCTYRPEKDNPDQT